MGNINYATINIAYKKLGINTKFVGLINSKSLSLFLILCKQLLDLVNLYITICRYSILEYDNFVFSFNYHITSVMMLLSKQRIRNLLLLVTQYLKGKWILKLKIALGGRETIAEGERVVLAYLADEKISYAFL